MLEHAVYFSRREQDELSAANAVGDHRAKQIHLMLAKIYSQLAKREMAELEQLSVWSDGTELNHLAAAHGTPRRYR